MMNEVKYAICSLLSGLFSLLLPIKDFMIAMVIVFGLNYLFGWIAGMKNGERWDLKKSMVFFYHCAVFFLLSASLFIVGYFLHNQDETLGVIKVLCGIAIWFYSTNIARNWKNILVEGTTMHGVACFVYYILTLKMVDKIPYLREYLTSNNNIQQQQGGGL